MNNQLITLFFSSQLLRGILPTLAFCWFCLLSFGVDANEPLLFGHSETLYSKALDQHKKLLVKLPQGYEKATDKRYPVLYTLDGNTHYRRVAGMIEWLSDTSSTLPQHIVVAIVTDSSSLRLRDFSTRITKQATQSGADRYIRFLSNELIPHINNKYRTTTFATLAGHSAAGRFTLYAMSEAPELFDAYIAMSPALSDNPRSQKYVEKIAQSLKSDNRPPVFVFMTLGNEPVYLNTFNALVKTFEQNQSKLLNWQSKIYPLETHMSTPSKTLHNAMLAIATHQGWHVPPAIVKQGLTALTSHYKAVSQRLGRSVLPSENVLLDLGYENLGFKKLTDAVAAFELTVKLYPNSPNAQDSLAEGYEATGLMQKALKVQQIAVNLAQKQQHRSLEHFKTHLDAIKRKLAM